VLTNWSNGRNGAAARILGDVEALLRRRSVSAVVSVVLLALAAARLLV